MMHLQRVFFFNVKNHLETLALLFFFPTFFTFFVNYGVSVGTMKRIRRKERKKVVLKIIRGVESLLKVVVMFELLLETVEPLT